MPTLQLNKLTNKSDSNENLINSNGNISSKKLMLINIKEEIKINQNLTTK
jgi:hypothetical protein